jgi:protein-tyrosine phosphatase
MARRHLDDKRIPTLNDTEYVLVEFTPRITYRAMLDALANLSSAGYIPVLAHVERYHSLVNMPRRMNELRDRFEIRFQVNCYSITRKNGLMVSRFLKKMLSDGLIDAIATDAHDINARLDLMPAAHKIISERYGDSYADYIAGVHGGFLFPEKLEVNEYST